MNLKRRVCFIFCLALLNLLVVLLFSGLKHLITRDQEWPKCPEHPLNSHLDQDGDSRVRYIRYECLASTQGCGGWGDRLKGILSVYALSKIMNRSFLMHVTHPCSISSLLRPNKIKWDLKLDQLDIKSIYELNVNYDFDLMKQFETIDFQSFSRQMNQHDLMNVHVSIMFTNSFTRNQCLQHRLGQLGYSSPNKFKMHHQMYQWYRELFQLAPATEAKYHRLLKRAKPNNETFLICLQIRRGGVTSQNKPDFRFTEPNSQLKFWSFVNRTFIKPMDGDQNYRIFLTTDFTPYKHEALRVFGQDKVVFTTGPSAHIDLDFRDLGDDCSSVENVIIDFHMFQNCDAAVVSHSSFGVLGAWNRPVAAKNFYVFTKKNQSELVSDYHDRSNLDFVQVRDLDEDLHFL